MGPCPAKSIGSPPVKLCDKRYTPPEPWSPADIWESQSLRAKVREWYNKLETILQTIELWGDAQINWLYFVPIFSSKDIADQMPVEGHHFNIVDTTFRSLIENVKSNPVVTECMGSQQLLDELKQVTKTQEILAAGITKYLELKRLVFPRFFFLSNDEMLQILSETKDPTCVGPHLKKCFDGISKLEFTENIDIEAISGDDGETVALCELISPKEAGGCVEKWMTQVEAGMLNAMKETISKSVAEYSSPERASWVQRWPGQVVLCTTQMIWTADIETHLAGDHEQLELYIEQLEGQLRDTISVIRGELSKQKHVTLRSLVVLDVHARDVTRKLKHDNVNDPSDFGWISQLRYYNEDDQVQVRLVHASISYAYEYVGNCSRLVITPLTERCYRTLIGAYHYHLNGAPEGPAGTGKTETTKDLAKALAVQCIAFNCSEGLDYISMGKFFKGLAACGAWACFDEFNRIEVEVLSVIAQQILSIVQGVRKGVKEVELQGTHIPLNPFVYVCITMNPGYAGRSDLPDNLKILFRSVAMMVPDYAMICQVALYSYGFLAARESAIKIVMTYRLCSEQLSSQSHYDYGMRAVKSILESAGNLKFQYPDESDDVILLRSITDMNVPKFVKYDMTLFDDIISDLFPGVTLPELKYSNLITYLDKVCSEKSVRSVPDLQLKIIQTYKMLKVRHGFMMVGEPFSGKTTVLQTLAQTLTRLNADGFDELPTVYSTLNPKAVTMEQLYGTFNSVSHEWSDGIISKIFREYAADESASRKWIIFDGPVDPIWIENMNTVLDDNRKLCLSSSEVIFLTQYMTMIFEVMDLEQASPATVSRCGMIYMEPKNIGWKPLVDVWEEKIVQQLKEDKPSRIISMFYWLIPSCLEFLSTQPKMLDCGFSNFVLSALKLFEIYTEELLKNLTEVKLMPTWIHAAALQSVVWGLGGTLIESSIEKFDLFLKDLWSGNNQQYPVPEDFDRIENLPTEGYFQDYFYVYKLKGAWKYWPDVIKAIKIDDIANLANFVVPTLETGKYIKMFEMLVSSRKQFLVIGPTGTGKSMYVQNVMMTKLNLDKFEPGLMAFTTSTSPNGTQHLILMKLFKLRRHLYGPPSGKTSAIFIDDISMPAKDAYGAQPSLELLRQYFDHGHWFDLKLKSRLNIQGLICVAAMGLPGGSRQVVHNRFLRHFTLLAINAFSEDTLSKIFSTLLFYGLRKNGFSTDVMQTVNNIISATIMLLNKSQSFLLPTPTKCHYHFNLRDILRVVNGHLLLKKESVDSKKVFVRLWVHECLRAFYDRLITDEDKDWLFQSLQDIVRDCWKDSFESVFEDLTTTPPLARENLRSLLFTVALSDIEEEDRKYVEPPSLDAIRDKAERVLEDYNSSRKIKMNLLLFTYALVHLSRILRVLSTPSGNALLVGVSGSGRQSLTKLSAALLNQNLYKTEINDGYGINDWREFLKMVLTDAGGKNKDCVFLFSEEQIIADYFLQDIDSLLNSGEVSNIFLVDEYQEIIEIVRPAVSGGHANIDVSALVVFAHFIDRCKKNVHIILCFSTAGGNFRNRLRLYPSLVNCCTIDWFEQWPEEALEKIATLYVDDVNVEDDLKPKLVDVFTYMHFTSRDLQDRFSRETGKIVYMTSSSYLDLIQSYTRLISQRQRELMDAKLRYINGLEKLHFAAEQVSIMQKDLESLTPQLAQAAKNTETMVQEIEKETRAAEQAAELVINDESVANKQAETAMALKADCEKDLAAAIPILEDAISALNTLKPADITLVKSMKNPPDTVKNVMAAVCVMKDIKPDRIPDPNHPGKKIMDYWGPSKRLLGDLQFLQSLKDYDKDNIQPQIMTVIRKQYLTQRDFDPGIVAKASSAAEGLCKWVHAMSKYDYVIKEVAPKKEKLAKAESDLKATTDLLNNKRNQLKQLQDKVVQLNKTYAEAMDKKSQLENEVRLCNTKLERAQKIIVSLGGENIRWNSASVRLQESYDCLPGDLVLSSGVIAYLGAVTAEFREAQITEWTQRVVQTSIPCSSAFSLREVLGSEIQIQEWTIQSLPNDVFSIENAVLLFSSQRWPLLIDPQGQANKWIKSMEKVNKLNVIKLVDQDYMAQLRQALKFGTPVLLENIKQELPIHLDPLLRKSFYQEDSNSYINFGGDLIEYNADFRFYITTRLKNPHYLPEVFNKTTVIYFGLTQSGLADQLLGICVSREESFLQSKLQILTEQSAKNALLLKELEDKILITLASTRGNILEDKNAVNILDDSKALSSEIMEKEIEADETKAKILGLRTVYDPVSHHCACLYPTITELSIIDPMYEFSLDWFLRIYSLSFVHAKKEETKSKRIQYIIEEFTNQLFLNVCRALFEQDKLVYSFILCTEIMKKNNRLNTDELKFLLRRKNGLRNTRPNLLVWLPDEYWDLMCQLEALEGFQGFVSEVLSDELNWKSFYDLSEPQSRNLPDSWKNRLTPFQQILVLNVFRPDQLLSELVDFIASEIGEAFIKYPVFDLSGPFGESNKGIPLILILSPSQDPMYALELFVEAKWSLTRFKSISLGQGQGPIAENLVKSAIKNGDWIALLNCHLASFWMPTLEKICENIDKEDVSDTFRLWLTSASSHSFPAAVLQMGIKLTTESSVGLKNTLGRIYNTDPIGNKEFFESCQDSKGIFPKLLYGVAFFHAVLLERTRFGPIGWNSEYGFDESDLFISTLQLKEFVWSRKENKIPFQAIYYMIGECNYGGRVTDYWDRRTLNTLLQEFVSQDVISTSFSMVADDPAYQLPASWGLGSFHKLVHALPDKAYPNVFGLHHNAGILRNSSANRSFLDTMILVGGQSPSEETSSDVIVHQLAGDILYQIPPKFDIEAVQSKFPMSRQESLNALLILEINRFNKLIDVIKKSLENVQGAVKGTLALSSDVEDAINSMLHSQVPKLWHKFSYPSLKPLASYITDFVARLKFFEDWSSNGKPTVFWLPGFFFTQAFLTGIIQNHARQHSIPIEQLTFDFQIQREPVHEITQAPDKGVYCHGLFLEGARFDLERFSLQEQLPKVHSEVFPPVWFILVLKSDLRVGERYECPVYKTAERKGILSTTGLSTNFVLPVLVNTNVPNSHWIKRGVALLCSLST